MCSPVLRTVNAQSLLVRATEKLLSLRQQDSWKDELPNRCPPVLWFGNAISTKPIVLTLGANPSRQEYLRDTSKQALGKVRQTNSHELLTYLEPPSNRFRILTATEELPHILHDEQLQSEIIEGYNSYFARNPYTGWFGHPKVNSYKVEGFLKGFGASYYPHSDQPLQAIHIDLFPFATLSDFNALHGIAYQDLFRDDWAASLVRDLITLFQPSTLILFGRSNVDHFGRYVDESTVHTSWRRYGNASYCIGSAAKVGVRFIGLSTNLGNPKGFTAASLKQYGQDIQQEIALL